MAIATELDGVVRMNIDPFNQFVFGPIQTSGTVNLDPALANTTTPYCYTDQTNEFWMRLSEDALTLVMSQRTGTARRPRRRCTR